MSLSMASRILRVGFVGAGGVNFGSPEGPWDHASRLEKLPNLKFVSIADPDTKRASETLAKRQQGPHGSMYEGCEVRATAAEMIEKDKPDVAFIGLMPEYHGMVQPPNNYECMFVDAGIHIFIEKPLSAHPPEEVRKTLEKVVEARNSKGILSSVGYMFRYSRAIEKMKEIIKEEANKHGSSNHVTMILAKFNCAYTYITKPTWWDSRRSGGPIVEQCTHVVDLARYLAESEADKSSLTALSINPQHERLGKLSDLQPAYGSTDTSKTVEDQVDPLYRPPRVTTTNFRFKSGAVCSITHGVQLHGGNIEAEIEVWADGLRLRLEDPYTTCRLTVRRSSGYDGGNGEKIDVFDFGGYGSSDNLEADPYYNEAKAFIDAVRGNNPSLIKSSYEDAFETYQLTWDIRRAAEMHG